MGGGMCRRVGGDGQFFETQFLRIVIYRVSRSQEEKRVDGEGRVEYKGQLIE